MFPIPCCFRVFPGADFQTGGNKDFLVDDASLVWGPDSIVCLFESCLGSSAVLRARMTPGFRDARATA